MQPEEITGQFTATQASESTSMQAAESIQKENHLRRGSARRAGAKAHASSNTNSRPWPRAAPPPPRAAHAACTNSASHAGTSNTARHPASVCPAPSPPPQGLQQSAARQPPVRVGSGTPGAAVGPNCSRTMARRSESLMHSACGERQAERLVPVWPRAAAGWVK
jgi:hypothetical protein